MEPQQQLQLPATWAYRWAKVFMVLAAFLLCACPVNHVTRVASYQSTAEVEQAGTSEPPGMHSFPWLLQQLFPP